MTKEHVGAFNQQITGSAVETQKVDKGFAHYVSHFKPREPVTTAIQVEQGAQGGHGWAVYFEQGRHRRNASARPRVNVD
jgi:hypothetical protein